jgi:5-hydroxyisourate hydrolase-like protein (transthyretin family)
MRTTGIIAAIFLVILAGGGLWWLLFQGDTQPEPEPVPEVSLSDIPVGEPKLRPEFRPDPLPLPDLDSPWRLNRHRWDISGTVSYGDGSPAADVAVEFVVLEHADTVRDVRVDSVFRTDENGRYGGVINAFWEHFERRRVYYPPIVLCAQAKVEGFALARSRPILLDEWGDLCGDITLLPPAEVIGRVLGGNNRVPVAGARATLYDGGVDAHYSTETDDEGRFRFEGVPATGYSLTVRHGGFFTYSRGCARWEPGAVKALPEDVNDLGDIVLEDFPEVTLQVKDYVTLAPIEGAVLYQWDGNCTLPLAVSDGDGRIHIALNSTIIGQLRRNAGRGQHIQAVGYHPGYLAATRLKPGEVNDLGSVYLAPICRISGTIVDVEGQPVESAMVSAYRARHWYPSHGDDSYRIRTGGLWESPAAERVTGEDGTFELDRLRDSPYFIEVRVEDKVVWLGLVHAPDEDLTIEVGATGTVTGTVTELQDDSFRAEKYRVVLVPRHLPVVEYILDRPIANLNRLKYAWHAELDGLSFRIENVPVGEYLLLATTSYKRVAIVDQVKVSPGVMLDFPVDLEITGELEVRLFLDGRPAAGVQVRLATQSDYRVEGRTAETDADGIARFKGLLPGRKSLEDFVCEYRGYRLGSARVYYGRTTVVSFSLERRSR